MANKIDPGKESSRRRIKEVNKKLEQMGGKMSEPIDFNIRNLMRESYCLPAIFLGKLFGPSFLAVLFQGRYKLLFPRKRWSNIWESQI